MGMQFHIVLFIKICSLHYIKNLIANRGGNIDFHGCQHPRKIHYNKPYVMYKQNNNQILYHYHTGHTVQNRNVGYGL